MTLPYPHARNDCGICREFDADVHVLGEAYNVPGKRPLLLCQNCLGKFITAQTIRGAGNTLDEPVTFTFAVAPERLHD